MDNEFQSSPSLSEGRYSRTQPPPTGPLRFNPRPPFRKGATLKIVLDGVPHGCFNPRPPFRKGATRAGSDSR